MTTLETICEHGELVGLRLTAPDGRELVLRRGTVDLETFEQHAKSIIQAWWRPFGTEPFTAIECSSPENVRVLSRILSTERYRALYGEGS